MITGEEVKHIAKLARLGLTEKEIKKYQKELSLVLDYIGKLEEVDISKVEPISHSITVENVIREDEIDKEQKTKNKKLLELAPQKKNDYLEVKSILK